MELNILLKFANINHSFDELNLLSIKLVLN
jgi:hypothetical protein